MISFASSKYKVSTHGLKKLQFLIFNTDEIRFYSHSYTKARQSYLSYEKKTDIRGCYVYMDAVLLR